jgi:hypothetical protein
VVILLLAVHLAVLLMAHPAADPVVLVVLLMAHLVADPVVLVVLLMVHPAADPAVQAVAHQAVAHQAVAHLDLAILLLAAEAVTMWMIPARCMWSITSSLRPRTPAPGPSPMRPWTTTTPIPSS